MYVGTLFFNRPVEFFFLRHFFSLFVGPKPLPTLEEPPFIAPPTDREEGTLLLLSGWLAGWRTASNRGLSNRPSAVSGKRFKCANFNLGTSNIDASLFSF